DIKTIFHPRNGKAPTVQSWEEYISATEKSKLPEPSEQPWKPFRTRVDFEFAEIMVKALLPEEHVESLIKLIKTVASGNDEFTIKNNAELHKLKEAASVKLTPFEEVKIQVPYEDEIQECSVWKRDLWDWAMDQLHDTRLTPHWAWDVMQLFRWNGTKWLRFWHEPWTANLFWRIQSALPEGGTPFGFILYADKTKLSSFGTQKAYPVIARCAQLPVAIRNSDGIGGGAVVGWLPIVDEGTAEEGKKGFVDFKRIVWHKAFYELLKKIEPLSKTGYQYSSADIDKLFYPFVAILAADYEEQCIMALIRGGHHSLCNCPRCLAKNKELTLLEKDWPLHTSEHMQRVIQTAAGWNKTAAEGLLKDYGLHPLENVFWKIQYSDPYKALSFDKLHSHDSGLFGDHIWPEVVRIIRAHGNQAVQKVDQQADAIPRWSGFAHFKYVVNIYFNDGTKYSALSKIIPYVAHNVIASEQDSEGFLILCLLRKYLELDMYYSFDVHTEDTIAAARVKLLEFSQCLKDYQRKTGPDGKDWNVPKVHYPKHGPLDIEDKGAMRNFNTKPDEHMHGYLKKTYLRHTNKRDVEHQILGQEHDHAVMQTIRADVDGYDEYKTWVAEGEGDEDSDDDEAPNPSDHILGAPQKPTTIAATLHPIAKDLHLDLADLLWDMELRTQDGQAIEIKPQDEIVEYRFLKVHYQSMETWGTSRDLLRCSPSFNKQERHDHVMVDAQGGAIFAQLLLIFTYPVNGVQHPFIVIRPYDGDINSKERDARLGFYRVSHSRVTAEVFPAYSIIRGALIVPDHSSPGKSDFFVMDIDPDMFCRLNSLRSHRFEH
ncbi:hypothetical protein DAEQUDRAFT_667378, partial [Daedalea quercina L-15889]